MAKRLITSTIIMAILGVVIFAGQQWYLSSNQQELPYSLIALFSFLMIAFVIITVAAEFLSKKLPSQVGFFYLATMFVKIGFFVLVFKNTLFSEVPLTLTGRINIFIPFFIFLVCEAIYCGRLMNAQ